MVHGVEKFRQIAIYRHTVARADVVADLVDGIVSREPQAKPEARLRKVWIENRIEYLGSGLLNQAVKDGGNSQRARAPVSFGISSRLAGMG